MGAQQSQMGLERVENTPPLDDYRCRISTPKYCVWEHLYQREGLIEIPVSISNSEHAQKNIEIFRMRHRHHILVSAEYFQEANNGLTARVFYERVFTNLSRIKDIPFNDSFQFYYVGLKGFQILYEKYGFFNVKEQMFHLTDKHKVKIWLHHDLSKIKPSTPSHQGSESDMVRRIIQIIDENVDHSTENDFPLGSLLYEDSQNFNRAIIKLRDICRSKNFIIPEKLRCMECIFQDKLRETLDEYSGVGFPVQNVRFFQKPISPNKQTSESAFRQKQVTPLTSSQMKYAGVILPAQNESQNQLQRCNSIPFNTIVGNKTPEGPERPQRVMIRHDTQVNLHRRGKGLQLIHHQDQKSLENCQKGSRTGSVEGKNIVFGRSNSINHFSASKNVTRQISRNHVNHNSSVRFVTPLPSPHFSQIPRPPPIFVIPSHGPPLPKRFPPSHSGTSHSFHPQGRPSTSDSFSSEKRSVYKVIVSEPPPANIHSQMNMNDSRKMPSPMPYQPNYATQSNFNRPVFQQQRPPLKINTNVPIRKDLNLNNRPSQFKENELKSRYSASSPMKTEISGKQNLRECQGSSFEQNKQTFSSPLKQGGQKFDDKQRSFQQYIKNFKFQTKKRQNQDEEDRKFREQTKGGESVFTKPEFWKKMDEITSKKTQNTFSTKTISSNETQKHLTTFRNTLNPLNTLISHETAQNQNENFDKRIKELINLPVFPSVTDISDNNSFLNSRYQAVSKGCWQQQSMVTKFDPNCIKPQTMQQKKYKPKIDDEIWSDVIELRKKKMERLNC